MKVVQVGGRGAVKGRNKDGFTVGELKLDPGDFTVRVKVRSWLYCQLRFGGNENTAPFTGVRQSVFSHHSHVKGSGENFGSQDVRGQPSLGANDDVRGVGGDKVVERGFFVSDNTEVNVEEAESVWVLGG